MKKRVISLISNIKGKFIRLLKYKKKHQIIVFTLIVSMIAGMVIFTIYFTRQVHFMQLEYMTKPVYVSLQKNIKSHKKWVGTYFKESDISTDSKCKINTAKNSWTQISIIKNGILVLVGKCEIILYPYKKNFFYLKYGTAFFWKHRKDEKFNGKSFLLRPFDFEIFTNKKNVKQGKTLVLKIQTTEDVKKVTGYFRYNKLKIFNKKNSKKDFMAFQGIDVWNKSGKNRIVVKCENSKNDWVVKAFKYNVVKKRYGVIRKISKRRKYRKKRTYLKSYWWKKWQKKKRRILSNNKPKKEREMLQEIYKKINTNLHTAKRFAVPVKNYSRISSIFGQVRYLTYGGGSPHRGIDYAAKKGTYVYSTSHGRVVFAKYTPVRGNLIVIDHGYGIFSSYFHLKRIRVRKGQFVNKNRLIGEMGTTGLSTGPHLHFEMRVGNICVDPSEWIGRSLFKVRKWYRILF